MKTRSFAALALSCACAVYLFPGFMISSASAQSSEATEFDEDDSVEAQLRALETAAYEEEADEEPQAREGPAAGQDFGATPQSMNPDISLVMDLSGAWFSGDADMHGGHDPQGNGFNLQGLELAISSEVDPYFRFDAAIGFELEGIEIEEAYATTLGLPAQLQLRGGQFMSNFGRLNPTHLHSWAFATQPLVNAKFFGGEGMRGLGAELSRLEMWAPGTLRWYVAAQNLNGLEGGSWMAPEETGDSEAQANWRDLVLNARLEEFVELSSDLDLLLGVSFALGKSAYEDPQADDDDAQKHTEIYGADAFLNWSSRTSGGASGVGWQTEFMLRRRHIPGATLKDFGLSSFIEWRLNRQWASALRGEFVSALGREHADMAELIDPEWPGARQRGAVQLSYYPSHFSRIRLQYELDRRAYLEDAAEQWGHMALLQLEFVVGAHGAHNY